MMHQGMRHDHQCAGVNQNTILIYWLSIREASPIQLGCLELRGIPLLVTEIAVLVESDTHYQFVANLFKTLLKHNRPRGSCTSGTSSIVASIRTDAGTRPIMKNGITEQWKIEK